MSDRGWIDHKPHSSRGCMRSRRGAASALIILLLVLLVFFSVLTLVTAAADWRLALRRAEWSAGYYQVDSQAQQVLARIGRLCRETDFCNTGLTEQAGQLAAALKDETIKDLAVRADGTRLRVEARILESAAAEQGIDLILLIGTAGKAGEELQIEVVRWSWWRAPFDYEAQADSVWEG